MIQNSSTTDLHPDAEGRMPMAVRDLTQRRGAVLYALIFGDRSNVTVFYRDLAALSGVAETIEEFVRQHAEATVCASPAP